MPFIVRWKGKLSEGITDSRPIIQLDVLPTALAAAGIPVQVEWKLDGVNLLPYLTGLEAGAPHQALFWRLGEHMAIRMGDWKLVKSPEGRLNAVDPAAPWDLSKAELYNLAQDISEQHNLAPARSDKVKELAEAWLRWNRELAAPRWGPETVQVVPPLH